MSPAMSQTATLSDTVCLTFLNLAVNTWTVEKTLKLLLSAGADLEAVDGTGHSALERATACGEREFLDVHSGGIHHIMVGCKPCSSALLTHPKCPAGNTVAWNTLVVAGAKIDSTIAQKALFQALKSREQRWSVVACNLVHISIHIYLPLWKPFLVGTW